MSTQFDRLVKISPYPVSMGLIPLGYAGVFRWGNAGDRQPYAGADFKPSIQISRRIISRQKKVATLLHEIGHAIHYRRHCRCYTDHSDYFLTEYHAQRFALRYMLRYKLKGALRYEIEDMKRDQHQYSKQWQAVIKQLMQEKIWEKCENYLTKGKNSV